MSLISLLKGFVVTVISLCLLLIFAPVILPLLLLFYIGTLIADILIKSKYGGSATRITGMSALFTQENAENSYMLNVAFRLNGEMESNKYRTKLLKILQRSNGSSGKLQFNRLMQVMDKRYGYTFWKDAKNFNIDQHIEIVQLEDLVKLSIERELNQKDRPVNKDYISELSKLNDKENIADWKILMSVFLKENAMKMLDKNLPLWQLLMLKESSEKYTILFRCHHAISDGIYLSRFLSEEILGIPFRDLYTYPYAKPSKLTMFLAHFWSIILIPVLLCHMFMQKDDESQPKQNGQKKYLLSNPISLEALKNVRKRTNSSFYGILSSCLSAALSLHFRRRSTILKDMGAVCPIPLQDLTKPLVLTNKFAAVSWRIPTHSSSHTAMPDSLEKNTSLFTTSTSLERLKMIQSIFQNARTGPWPLSLYNLIRIISSNFPTNLIKFVLPTKGGGQIAFSNIPGPPSPIYYDKDLLENIMFWGFNTPRMPIAMTFQSYNGKLCVGLVVDEALLQEENEGDLILSDFENEVQNIIHELDTLKVFKNEEEVLISNP